MEKNFTEQDSLKLINEMITQARNNMQKGSVDSLIFAGYSVAITSIINFILLHVLTPAYLSFWIWLLMIPMSVVCLVMGRRNEKKALVKTHVDKTITVVWFSFFITTVLFLACVFTLSFVFKIGMIGIIINPVMLILMGSAQYTTGVISRFAPFRNGAFVFWGGAILSIIYPLFSGLDLQFIILAVCMIFGFVVPGHILNRKAKENV